MAQEGLPETEDPMQTLEKLCCAWLSYMGQGSWQAGAWKGLRACDCEGVLSRQVEFLVIVKSRMPRTECFEAHDSNLV